MPRASRPDPVAPRSPAAAEPDEATLVVRLKEGEEAAFEVLVRTYGSRMLAVARRFLPRDADAEDALQDAFLNAFKAIRGFAGESRLSTWLHRITVNAALMRIRSRSRRPESQADESVLQGVEERGIHDWSTSADEALSREEVRERLRSALAGLPDDVRAVVRLRDIEGLDLREIASLLGIGLSTVKTRLHRGRLALRAVLDGQFGAVIP